ncbi:T9SS type A sorting domain-containing protein [Flavobacterium ovatum]|uniref:T9SS type A sorting domain-containing protein n=1 Tax=Flavobacterium ovatum TaxID=1928857 RepID=UPI00345071E9
MKKNIFYTKKKMPVNWGSCFCCLTTALLGFLGNKAFTKKLIFYATMLLMTFSMPYSYGQLVGSSAVKANFGIDADVYSDLLQFSNIANPPIGLGSAVATDDWFQTSYPGPGFGVIDQSPLTPAEAVPNTAFTRRLSITTPSVPFPFPLVPSGTGANAGAYLWLDAVYGRDTYTKGGGAEKSYFSSGSDKNAANPSTWSIGTAGSVPAKDDIIDVYAHLRGEGPKDPTMLDPRPFTTLYAYAAASLVVTNGNKHIDFEFFRTALETPADLAVPGKTGPDGGRTAFTFNPDGTVDVPGTIIISIDYTNGGNVPQVRIRVWMDEAIFNTYDNTNVNRPFTIDKNVAFEKGSGSGTFGYAAIVENVGDTNIWGRVNINASTQAPPWGTFEGSGPSAVADYQPLQFVEIGINLTAFGLDKRGEQSPCSNILGSLLVKTRSSGGGPNEGAFGSELKDFAGPFLFGNTGTPPEIKVANKEACGSGNPTTAEVNLTMGTSVTGGGGAIQYFLNADYTGQIMTPTTYAAPLGTTTIYVRSEKLSNPGCYGFNSFTVTVNAPPNAPTLGKVDPTCTVATGCVTVTSSTAGLTFSIDDGAYVTYPANGWCGLASGSHSVKAKNADGCISGPTQIVIPVQPPTPSAPTLGKVDPTCTVATGCVTVTSSTAGLTFSIDDGAYVTYPANGWCGLASGSHSVKAKNADGCISGPTQIVIPVQPPTPSAPTLGKVDPTCTVATGCVTVTSSTAGLTFSIDDGAYVTYPANGWCGLASGSHSVKAKNADGCISGPTQIVIPVQPPTPSAPTLGKVDPTCTVATGCVTVTSSTAGLTFSIDDGAYVTYPANGWCGLVSGSHSVKAKNADGCISGPTQIVIPVQPPTPSAPTLGKVDPTCTVATGCVTVTSSTAGLTFSIDDGAYVTYPANGWCGLASGSHSVKAKNADGCISGPTQIVIPVQPPTPSAPTLGKVDPTCTVATGCVTVTSSTAGLTFSIDDGAYVTYPANGWCGLASGSHSVKAKNADGCISGPTQIVIPVQPPTPSAPTLGKVDPTCTVATGCVTVTSSTAGLTFSIDDGAYVTYPANGWCGLASGSHSVKAKNADGCISGPTQIVIPVQPPTPSAPTLGKVDPTCTVATGCVTVTSSTAGLTFSIDDGAYVTYPANGWCGLASGSHSVKAKNADGCISGPTQIVIPVQPPTPSAPTLGKVDPTCTVATGCVTVTSSTAGLTFSIDDGAYVTYPANGWCGLASGSHSVKAKNADGCISGPTQIVIPVQPPTPSAPTLGKVDPTCTVATGCVTVTSSTAGLTFSIDDGAYVTYPANGWCGLASGSHSVKAKNAAGCISGPTQIVIPVQPPTPSAPTLGKVDPTCTVATGCVTVTSSTAGLTFSIDDGAYVTYPANGWCGLASGSHSVKAKNADGCISGPTQIVIPVQPPTPSAPILGKVDPTCTVATGCVTVTSSTAGLTFSIDDGAYVTYPANGWCGLASSSHSVKAKNADGCISGPTQIVIPVQPPTPSAPTLGKVDPTCTVATGCVTVTSSTAGLTFSIDDGAYVTYPANGWCGLASGSHSVKAKNADGCISGPTQIVIPVQPPTPSAPTLGKVDPTCTVATGCVTVTSSTAGLTFSIDDGAYVTYPANGWCGLASGSHSVKAKNADGCISGPTQIVIPVQPPTPSAPTLGKVDPTCTVATGCVTVTSSTAGLTFSIDDGAYVTYPANGWCGLASGSHSVKAKNAAGCISGPTQIVIPVQPPTPILNVTNPVAVCSPLTVDLTVPAVTAGSTLYGASLTYWTNVEATNALSNPNMVDASGMYYIKATTTAGCFDIKPVVVTIEICAKALCTYTQGYYGNAGGTSCAEGISYSTKGLIAKALASYENGTMYIGIKDVRHVSIMNNDTDINALISVMPGGGGSSILPSNPNSGLFSISSLPNSMLKKGRINNTLLAQTIALGLNIGINGALGNFVLQDGILAVAVPDGGCGTDTAKARTCNPDGTVNNEYKYYTIPGAVVTALGANPTVQGVFNLANQALGGGSTNGLSLSQIAGMADLINNAFDECRIPVGYGIAPLVCPVLVTTTDLAAKTADVASFTAYPVPFKDQLTIKYDFDYVSDVKIEVFNAQSELVFSTVDAKSYLNKEVTITVGTNSEQEQVYIVKLTTDRGSSIKKIMSSN